MSLILSVIKFRPYYVMGDVRFRMIRIIPKVRNDGSTDSEFHEQKSLN